MLLLKFTSKFCLLILLALGLGASSYFFSYRSPFRNMVIKVVSLNANGLQSQVKRRAIFKNFRDNGYDLCLLQETHSTPGIEKIWQSEWGGQIMYSHGESNARGVAILAKRGCEFVITRQAADEEGRCLVAKFTKDNESYIVANVYAPTQDFPAQQATLIDYLEDLILESGEYNILVGGDLNLCLNPSLDRSSTSTQGHTRGRQYKERVLFLLETLNLMDIWRHLNPGVKRSTFRRGDQSSRLDF